MLVGMQAQVVKYLQNNSPVTATQLAEAIISDAPRTDRVKAVASAVVALRRKGLLQDTEVRCHECGGSLRSQTNVRLRLTPEGARAAV